MHTRPFVYFAAPDLQMEPFLDDEALLRAFVYGVLFQGDLVVADSLFYLSERFANLLRNPSTGRFIQAAVRTGAIVPAFRQPAESFRENLEHIRKNLIVGILPDADEVAGALDSAINGVRLHPLTWPDTPVSVGFKEIVERSLLNESTLPAGSPMLDKFFETTREMRSVVIEGVTADLHGGIKRGDLNARLASHLGIDDGNVLNHCCPAKLFHQPGTPAESVS